MSKDEPNARIDYFRSELLGKMEETARTLNARLDVLRDLLSTQEKRIAELQRKLSDVEISLRAFR